MITIQSNRLIIDIEHPDPEELLKDLQDSLLSALRLLGTDAGTDVPMLAGKEFSNASFAMIELLQAIIIYNRTVQG